MDREEETNSIIKDNLPTVKQGLINTLAVVTLLGVVVYYGEKRLEYGKKFDLMTFIVGKPKCKYYTRQYTLSDKLKALI